MPDNVLAQRINRAILDANTILPKAEQIHIAWGGASKDEEKSLRESDPDHHGEAEKP